MTQSGPNWRKSSHSGSNGGQCVECAGLRNAVGVRDSKDTARGHFSINPAAWASFVAALKLP